MAELGDYLEQGTSRKEVTVDMLEYKFIDECEDKALLRSVLGKLKSGEEGSFPHLTQRCEDKLMGLLSEKERRKVVSLRSGPSHDDISDAGESLGAFIDKARAEDQAILQHSSGSLRGGGEGQETNGREGKGRGQRALPPVRGQKAEPTKPTSRQDEAGAATTAAEPVLVRTPSSHVYDAPNYFRKWDAYDAEAEEAKLDGLDKAQREAVVKANKAHAEKERLRGARRLAELVELRKKMSFDQLTVREREAFAKREKAKGNECFKAGEAEEAMHFYSRALALLDDNGGAGPAPGPAPGATGAGAASPSQQMLPVLWANRAMAALKLGLLEKAEEDCSVAIRLDPSYHKARLRRGMTRHKRGKYAEAASDFTHLLNVNNDYDSGGGGSGSGGGGCGIPDVDKLLERSLEKLREVGGSGVANAGSSNKGITEISSSSSTSKECGSVQIDVLDGVPPPDLTAPLWERRPFVDPPPPPQETDEEEPEAAKFTKVAITFGEDDEDDSSDSDSDEEVKGKDEKMTRIAIASDDDDDDDDDADGDLEKDASTFTRVSILDEEDSEEDGDDDEEEEEPLIEDVTTDEESTRRTKKGGGPCKIEEDDYDDGDEAEKYDKAEEEEEEEEEEEKAEEGA